MISIPANCRIIVLLLFGFISLLACQQNNSSSASEIIKDSTINLQPKNPYYIMDQSPMDMIYAPTNYPIEKIKNADSLNGPYIRIIYSRPHKKGRNIFGDDSTALCHYEKPW